LHGFGATGRRRTEQGFGIILLFQTEEDLAAGLRSASRSATAKLRDLGAAGAESPAAGAGTTLVGRDSISICALRAEVKDLGVLP
jgi:hypothetical protein